MYKISDYSEDSGKTKRLEMYTPETISYVHSSEIHG